MNHTQLRAFHAVARLRSYSRAAEALHITQPAVTIQVKALEAAHGLRLFRRSGREILPTEAGQALFEMTQLMFVAEERIREYLEDSTSLDTGSLALATDGPHIALDIVSAFLRRHPRVRVAVRLGNTQATMQALVEQRADAAILANPPPDPRLVVLPIRRRSMLALLPRDHRLARRRRLTLRDVAEHPVVMREQGSTTRRLLDDATRRAGIALRPILELGSREAMREAVARGLGIGFLFERETDGDSRTLAVPLADMAGVNLDTVVCLAPQARRTVVRALFDIAGGVARGSGKRRRDDVA